MQLYLVENAVWIGNELRTNRKLGRAVKLTINALLIELAGYVLPRIGNDMWHLVHWAVQQHAPVNRARSRLLRRCTPARVPVEQAQARSGPLNQLAEFLARFEEGNSLRWHIDPSAGLWITSRATTPLARVEGAESPNLHLVAGSQCTDDAVQYRADDDVSLLQGQPNDLVNLAVISALVNLASVRSINNREYTGYFHTPKQSWRGVGNKRISITTPARSYR